VRKNLIARFSDLTRPLAVAAMVACVVAGCAKKPPADGASALLSPAPPSPTQLVEISADKPAPATDGKPVDAKGEVAVIIQIEVWQLRLPMGTISRNEEFWKRINEQCVDVGSYDLLFKNGVRVGEAPQAEWEYLRTIMEQYPAVAQRTTFGGSQGEGIEFTMKEDVDAQNIFFFDAQNRLSGRSYDQSENLLTLRFEPTPRKLGSVRIAMCPVVRSTRKRLEFNIRHEEREIQYKRAERVYECSLRVDVPLGSFLIVAPSEAARRETSVGHAFLTKDGDAEQFEQIMVITPRPYTVEVSAPLRR